MRTTLNLNDHLLDRARAAAAAEGITLTSLFEDALRRALSDREDADAPPYIDLPVLRSPGPFVLPEGVTADRIAHIFDDEDGHVVF